VTTLAGQVPRFWGQYVDLSDCDVLTQDIASYLHGEGCYIWFLYQGATAESVATKAQGETATNDAIAATNNLGVPAGVCLFNPVESGWQVTSEDIGRPFTTAKNASPISMRIHGRIPPLRNITSTSRLVPCGVRNRDKTVTCDPNGPKSAVE